MTSRWSCATTVYTGEHAWEAAWAEHVPARDAFVVADAGVASPVAPDVRLDPARTDLAAVERLAAELAEHRPPVVVGIGGGSVLDVLKLACLQLADPRALPVIRARGRRAGLVVPPRQTCVPQPVRVFVPTTIGTGVEVSPVACVTVAGHKRLVSGEQLRPDAAVLDPRFTATLPYHLLVEGVLEALLRVLGLFGGSPAGDPLADAEAVSLIGQLVEVGDRLAAGDGGAGTRLYAAQLSAATHTGRALTGRDTYAAKHWYLANELSTALGVRKMTATAAILPAVWARVLRGDRRYGRADRPVTAWRHVWVASSRPLSADPVLGLTALLDHWRISRHAVAPPGALWSAADNAVRAWGGRLPMLAGLHTEEIARLFTAAVSGAEVAECSTW